jgi:hypothetical protein
MLSVQDEGIGMAGDRLDRLNARLADFDPESAHDHEGGDGLGLGLYVVARLAHRHGIRVQLREQKQGGVAAVVVLPAQLLAEAPQAGVPHQAASAGGTGTFSLPGADAEVNSNVLHARTKGNDPLVALAEQAVHEHERTTQGRERSAHASERAGHEPERTGHGSERSVHEPEPSAHGSEPSAHGREQRSLGSKQAVHERGRTVSESEPSAHEHEQAGSPVEPEGTRPKAPPETLAETTMELLLPDLSDRPKREGRAMPEAEPHLPAAAGGPEAEDEAEAEVVTSKGLPKRTPKITSPAPQAPRRRSGGVDADALRRRLGGFRQGAVAGYRDVEAEIAERTGQATGGTVEEASS